MLPWITSEQSDAKFGHNERLWPSEIRLVLQMMRQWLGPWYLLSVFCLFQNLKREFPSTCMWLTCASNGTPGSKNQEPSLGLSRIRDSWLFTPRDKIWAKCHVLFYDLSHFASLSSSVTYLSLKCHTSPGRSAFIFSISCWVNCTPQFLNVKSLRETKWLKSGSVLKFLQQKRLRVSNAVEGAVLVKLVNSPHS
jgi:hypothetical protein